MSRTLEPGISLLTSCEIRVVVLPIGPMPRDTFDGYLDVFNAHRHVPLNATRSFYQGGPKSPFSHLPYKTGAMHFRFIQADEARRRTRISDLHQQRQVIAVLGLLHCPLVEDIMAAHSEFGRASRQWPEALVARCCAFEPSNAHLSTPGCQKLPDLMIFPGGHLHQHLEVYMHEFAASVLAAIEDYLLNASVVNVKLNTYVDSGDFLGSMAQIEEGLRKLNINEEELKEKKRWGRFQKLKGDWALMAGSPRDAFEHYKSAMELSRTAADAIWYGAAVEGLAHAHVLEALITARQPAAVGGTAAAAARSSVAALPQQPAGSVASCSSSTVATPPGQTVAAAAAVDLFAAESAEGAAQAAAPDVAAATDVPSAAVPRGTTIATGSGSSSSYSNNKGSGIFTLSSTELSPAHSAAAAAIAACALVDDGTTVPGAAVEGDVAVGSDTAAASAKVEPAAAAAAVGVQQHSPQLQLPADVAAAAATPTGEAVAALPTPPGSSKALSAASKPSAAAAAAAGGGPQVLSGYALSGPAAWSVLAQADLEGEVRELMAEARSWYKKKGGALVLQIEQTLKLSRFVAGLRGAAAARKEASEAVALISESLPALALPEDRLIALVEAGQVLGLAGCGRKRLLLLWSALDMFRSSTGSSSSSTTGSDKAAAAAAAAPPSDAAAMLRLALRGLAPPDQPQQQDMDDLPRVHWSMLRLIAWQQQHITEQQLAAAHTGSSSKASAAAPGGSSSSHRRRGSITAAPTAAADSSKQQQRQQFHQLLGPQLQLLSPDQAAVYLQRLGGYYHIDPSSNPAGSSFSNPNSGSNEGVMQARTAAAAAAAAGACDWLYLWDSVLVAVLEAVMNVSKVANAPVEAWEAAATLLRECYSLLPQALQVLLLESCASAATAMGSRARSRPGQGPGPQVQLKRIMPGSPSLQPIHLASADLRSTAAGSGSNAGGGLRRSETNASSHGPFIFNPYAAKRKGASAAAAAEAALPEWVCGTEGHVEVLLVNPCATPLKLDQLQLIVQPLPLPTNQQQQQQQGSVSSSSSSSSSGIAVARSVSVSLAAGSKPVRVVLSYTPMKPGLAAVTGIQASCWGVSWYQPFVVLPRVTAAAAAAGGGGQEAVVPQGCFTVVVQPQLPLVKAVLHGPEVQLVQPSDEELAGLLPAAATFGSSSSTSSTWSAAAGASGGSSGLAAASGTSAAAAADLDKKVINVFAFEGQTLNWTLNLTNMSDQPVTGCKVVVLNAKGTVIKPFNTLGSAAAAATGSQQQQQQQQHQLPASFSGAHMEVSESGLSAGLPLLPGSSMSLPVTVYVGKPPGDAFDAVMLQVRITYYGSATSITPNSSSSSSNTMGSEPQVLGRRLTLPLKLSIQPTLQVTGVRFLQQTIPLKDGLPITTTHTRSPTKHTTHTIRQHTNKDPSPAAAVAAAGFETATGVTNLQNNSPYNCPKSAMIWRQQSKHVRNSSEGAVPVFNAGMDVSDLIASAGDGSSRGSSPTRRNISPSRSRHVGFQGIAAAAAVEGDGLYIGQQQQQQQHASSVTPAAAAAAAGPMVTQGSINAGSSSSSNGSAGGLLSVGSAPVLELSVRNASERYFRAWLGSAPDHLTAESPLSAVVVLEPGDTQKLTALLPTPTPATAAGGMQGNAPPAAAAGGVQGYCAILSEPSRLQCAEALVDQLVVCWEMITGAAAAAGQLPRGRVQLAPVDVAANITQGAVAALWPSPLLLRVCAVPTAAAAAGAQLMDLLSVMKQSGHPAPLLPGLSGPLWGLQVTVGQWLALDLEVTYSGSSSSSSTNGALDSSTSGSEQHKPLLLQVTLSATDILTPGSGSSSSTGQPGTPSAAAAAAFARSTSVNLMGRSSNTGQGLTAAAGVLGFGSTSSNTLIDPGVFMAGCYSGLQVQVRPGSKVVHKFRALLVQPGLYQFGVADVTRGDGVEGAIHAGNTPRASAAAAGGGGGSSSKGVVDKSGRVYFSQERMFVLVT